MGLNRSKKPAMCRLFRIVVNNVLRSGEWRQFCAARLQAPASTRQGTTVSGRRHREMMDSKQQFRSGKPATQSLHQIAVEIAVMRAAIFHAVLMAAPISLTDITRSAAAAARASRRDRHMFLPPDGSPGADSMGLELLAFFNSIGETLTKNIWISLALAAVFTVLTSFWACNPGRPWWRKPDIVTDLCYWFFIPVIARYLRIGMLIVGAALLFGITTADGLIAFYDNGHGPLAALPIVAQMVLFLVGEDFILYWTHRWLPRRENVEVPRRAPFLRGAGMDLGGALPSGQPVSRQRVRRRRLAACRHLAQRLPGARALDHRPFRLRARQSRLDAGTVQIRHRRPGVPPLAPHRGGARRRAEFCRDLPGARSSCSAPSICRPASCRIITASPSANFPRRFRPSSPIRSRSEAAASRISPPSLSERHRAVTVESTPADLHFIH